MMLLKRKAPAATRDAPGAPSPPGGEGTVPRRGGNGGSFRVANPLESRHRKLDLLINLSSSL